MATDNLSELLSTLQTSLESAASALPDESQLQPPPNGISLLDVKNELFLSYLHNLVFLILFKIRQFKEGFGGEGDDSKDELWDETVRNLVRLRLYSEKGVKPIENRLRYEIDRVIQAAEDASNASKQQSSREKGKKKKRSKGGERDEGANGISASASSDNDEDDDGEDDLDPTGSASESEDNGSSISGSESEDEDEDEEEEELPAPSLPSARGNLANFRLPGSHSSSRDQAGAGRAAASTSNDDPSSSSSLVYRPPRVAPTSMPAAEQQKRRRGKEVRSEALDAYIAEELSGAPAAQPSVGANIERAGRSTQTGAQRRAADERRAYEEANFVRLPAQSKKERQKLLQQGGGGGGKEGAIRNGFGGEDWRDLGAGAERVMKELDQRRRGQGALERSRKRDRDAPDEVAAGGPGKSSFEKKRKMMQKRAKR